MRLSLNKIRVELEPRDWLICSKPECLFKVFTQADKEKSSVRVNEASSSHHKRTQPATVCVSGLVAAQKSLLLSMSSTCVSPLRFNTPLCSVKFNITIPA